MGVINCQHDCGRRLEGNFIASCKRRVERGGEEVR